MVNGSIKSSFTNIFEFGTATVTLTSSGYAQFTVPSGRMPIFAWLVSTNSKCQVGYVNTSTNAWHVIATTSNGAAITGTVVINYIAISQS